MLCETRETTSSIDSSTRTFGLTTINELTTYSHRCCRNLEKNNVILTIVRPISKSDSWLYITPTANSHAYVYETILKCFLTKLFNCPVLRLVSTYYLHNPYCKSQERLVPYMGGCYTCKELTYHTLNIPRASLTKMITLEI